MTPNRQEPGRLNTGITVIGKRAMIPRGVRIGRNVKIAEGVRTSDYRGRIVRSGQTVERHRETGGPAGMRAALAAADGSPSAPAALHVRQNGHADRGEPDLGLSAVQPDPGSRG